MKSTLMMTAAASVLALAAMTGCSSNPTNNAAIGAVAGGVAGNVLLGGPLATVGGAAVGAVIGNETAKKK